MTIGEILSMLSPNNQAILQYAHEHQLSQYIEFSPGKFIGVHAERISYLAVEATVGDWSIGTIRGRNEILHKATRSSSSTV